VKIVRFEHNGQVGSGCLEGETISPLALELDFLPRIDREYSLGEVRLLAPSTPSKIVAVGLNYRDHAAELNMTLPEEPLLFLKPPTAVIGPGDEILYPKQSERIDYEAELAIVIGKRARFVDREKAADYILGYTCINDVTARDLQAMDIQFTRAKGFDTFAPLGPWIETELDTSDLSIKSRLNGELKQSSRTYQLISKVDELVAFISSVMTLLPGDVIATGTPSGIGPMQRGDTIEISISGIGVLSNTVAEE
jgi:2-keto-4-pentenoate hydratase/2-oxohepta-3-ene-1,7-dioic acid hydratase in catechol pathway